MIKLCTLIAGRHSAYHQNGANSSSVVAARSDNVAACTGLTTEADWNCMNTQLARNLLLFS